MNEISTYQFFMLYQTKANIRLIDVRENYEYDQYYIEGSQNVPMQLLIDRYYLFVNPGHHYYIICQNGVKSKIASTHLSNQGISVTNVVGGIMRWPGKVVRPQKQKIL